MALLSSSRPLPPSPSPLLRKPSSSRREPEDVLFKDEMGGERWVGGVEGRDKGRTTRGAERKGVVQHLHGRWRNYVKLASVDKVR